MCCSLLLATDIWAFFPIGVYDAASVLRYRTYRIGDFDLDNDGEVAEDEGIEVRLEGGRSGFTEAELDIVREAIAVWERVPQSYASMNVTGVFEDPVIVDGFSDLQNTIVMYVDATVDLDGDGFPDEDVVPDPAGTVPQPPGPGVLGYQISTWAGEDVIIDTPSESYLVSAGTIVDSDIVINAALHRAQAPGEEPIGELLATMVHEIGHFYGLQHTPLNNLHPELIDPSDPLSVIGLVETTALTHSIGGVKNRIGATPTMYPFSFSVLLDNGDRGDGQADLAPDDISAISWLYPRGSQDLFFSLRGEARTHTRPGTGLPSIQIGIGHIVAWADVDNDDSTPRVPLFSTFSSYYENPQNVERDGRFNLLGMWKTMETESGLFNASYTFTLNPMNGAGEERQAPASYDPISQHFIFSAGGRAEPFNAYPSEVFHEVENIIDLANTDAGTPLMWDFQRGTLVSMDTERSISSILGENPMFGDPNDVCILNVVSAAKAVDGAAGLGSAAEGANAVRSVRDGVLLSTALGSFVVDTYYKVSPTAARFLLQNDTAYNMTVKGVDMVYWCLDHLALVLGMFAGIVAVAGFAYRRRLRRSAAVGLVALAAMVASGADAQSVYQTTEQLVAGATDIISGRITSVTTRAETSTSHIYTDIVIEVEDKAKGTLNKQSSFTFTQIGGQLEGRITEVSEFPSFKASEEVVLYLYYIEDYGYVVYNAASGKQPVSVNKTTGEKTVRLPADLRAKRLKNAKAGEVVPESVPVAEYMAELRAIAKSLKK